MQFQKALNQLTNIEQVGDYVYKANCPAHEDTDRQLVCFNDGGSAGVHCKAGCSKEDILRALHGEALDYYRDSLDWSFDPLLSYIKPLTDFEEEEANWLIPGWIPEGQITLMAADGGVGKTTLWVNLAAAISNGTPSLLDGKRCEREPGKVLILTTEDSIRKKLRQKLRLAGADLDNILAPDFLQDKSGELMQALHFGSPELARLIRKTGPALCIFDPVQGFVPPEINMASRNAMRQCLAPLISLGEETGTSFLVVCHSNKRKGASGRDRIADSADLWDIARSVLMMGYGESEQLRYIANEKNNYAQRQETVLFAIDSGGRLIRKGTSPKTDRDFMRESQERKEITRAAPMREECKAFILETLREHNGSIPVRELEEKARVYDYSAKTLRTAKEELKNQGEIEIIQKGHEKNKKWYIVHEHFVDVTTDELLPWEVAPLDRS